MNKEIKIKIKEIKDETNMELITSIMKYNNGYITSRIITDLGISRQYLRIMLERNIIEKVAKGVYVDKTRMEDSFYTFSLELPNVIYSHMTALYFYGIAPKAPYREYDITVYNKYFNHKLKNHNVFYVDKDILNIGLANVKTPNGNTVQAYDMERCICDIIRSINRMDIDLVKRSIREYLKRKDKDLTKLSLYADKMGIKNKVMDFLGIMYE